MSAEAIGQQITSEERIELLLACETEHVSRLPGTEIKNRWGSRNIEDGSRIQLVVSQKSTMGDEGRKEHRLLCTYSAEPGYEIDEQYDLAGEVYSFAKRSVAYNGQINNGDNSNRFRRPLSENDYRHIGRLIDRYTQADEARGKK